MSRKHLDHYTEHIATTYLIRELMALVPEIRGTIIEPCAGEGFMADALAEFARVSLVKTNDINPQYQTDFVGDARCPVSTCWDYLVQNQRFEAYDLAVTNPPYDVAFEILKIAFKKVNVGVAFLLRHSFDEPTKKRVQWFKDHADQLRYRIPVNPRPEWRKGEINPKTGKLYGNDSVTNTWFVWLKQFSWQRDFGIESPFKYIHGWRPDKTALKAEQERLQEEMFAPSGDFPVGNSVVGL